MAGRIRKVGREVNIKIRTFPMVELTEDISLMMGKRYVIMKGVIRHR